MPKALSSEQIIRILREGDFNHFIDAIENEQFECKSEPYRLDDEHQRFEFAKDVSALTNSNGGVIVIGLRTSKDLALAADVVAEVRPFSASLVDIAQYENVLKDWIYPNLQKLEIKWFPTKKDLAKGLVGIIIANQDQLWRPFLITKSVETSGKISTVIFGYAERRVDKSSPMSVQQIHLLLRDGYRFESGISAVPTSEGGLPSGVSEPVRDRGMTEQFIKEILSKRIQSAILDVNLARKPVFVLAAMPDQPTTMPSLFSSRQSDVVKMLERPKKLRRGGFGPDAGSDSRIIRGELRRTIVPDYSLLELWKDGTVIFVLAGDEDGLSWASKSPTQFRINQLALIEIIYLFAKLSSDILKAAQPSPRMILYHVEMRRMNREKNPLLFGGILNDFGIGDRKTAPDSGSVFRTEFRFGSDPRIVAFGLVALVYQWFGFDDEEIPYSEETPGDNRIISPDLIIDLHGK